MALVGVTESVVEIVSKVVASGTDVKGELNSDVDATELSSVLVNAAVEPKYMNGILYQLRIGTSGRNFCMTDILAK